LRLRISRTTTETSGFDERRHLFGQLLVSIGVRPAAVMSLTSGSEILLLGRTGTVPASAIPDGDVENVVDPIR
jgi:hypothetical protein